MNMRLRDVPGRGAKGFEHWRGPAAIKMTLCRCGQYYPREIEHFSTVFAVTMDFGKISATDFVKKGELAALAAGIVKFEHRCPGVQPLHHGKDWRDADAAGDQDMVGSAESQRKVIARSADCQRLADFQILENISGATPACRISLMPSV